MPALDDGERALDRRDRRGAAHRRGGGKAQVLDAEIGDEVLGHRAVAVGDQTVDVGRLQAGIAMAFSEASSCSDSARAVGAAHVLGFADAGDGASLAQGHDGCSVSSLG